jgi:hypothetical protein
MTEVALMLRTTHYYSEIFMQSDDNFKFSYQSEFKPISKRQFVNRILNTRAISW